MTTKFIKANLISIRPQSDAEKILVSNINAMLVAGKQPSITFKDSDMILEIKSNK